MKIKVTSNRPKFAPIQVNVSFTIENPLELAEFSKVRSLLDEGEAVYLTDDTGIGLTYNSINELIGKLAHSVG